MPRRVHVLQHAFRAVRARRLQLPDNSVVIDKVSEFVVQHRLTVYDKSSLMACGQFQLLYHNHKHIGTTHSHRLRPAALFLFVQFCSVCVMHVMHIRLDYYFAELLHLILFGRHIQKLRSPLLLGKTRTGVSVIFFRSNSREEVQLSKDCPQILLHMLQAQETSILLSWI